MKTLIQKKLLNGKREFELIDDKHLRVKYSSVSKSNEETVELFNLEDKHERIVYREMKWAVIAAPLCLLGFKFGYDAIKFPDAFPIFIAAAFLFAAAMAIVRYVVVQQDQIVIRFHQTQNPAVVFWNCKPTKEEFGDFVNELTSAVSKLRVNPNLRPEEKLDIYLRHLRFLCDESVLSEHEAQEIYDRTALKMLNKENTVVSLVR